MTMRIMIFGLLLTTGLVGQPTQKPVLYGQHWMAITGKPLAATAGATIFQQGGNAVDAACAMLAATCTMWDVLAWGGETQALIYHPKLKKVIAINGLGVAPTGATPEFFKDKGMQVPPEYGPLAAVTPGTPGGLCLMLAEYGTMSLAQVLAPAITLAGGYPIEAQTANAIERGRKDIEKWPYSKQVFFTHPNRERVAPDAGEIFRQVDLQATLLKLVETEKSALKAGKGRKAAIYAAQERFYKGDIAREFVRGCQEQGGLITLEDLARWKPLIEEPVMTTYKGIEVYKLNCWQQSPVMLQALNMLENLDLNDMGYNSYRYIHALYQVMNLTFADRDFYYGDPYFPPVEPMKGLLSKEYAKERLKEIKWDMNDANAKPGDPYPFQQEVNPFLDLLQEWGMSQRYEQFMSEEAREAFYIGTTSVQAADKEGWVVSMTPSGGWLPSCIAGRTGVGMSQRMQAFVLDEKDGPYNVLAPGKRPRSTLTPTLALKEGRPYLSFAVQGGDSQDQNLLQFFLNMVEFDMTVQEACEAPNFNSFQLRASFGHHEIKPGLLELNSSIIGQVSQRLESMGYRIQSNDRTSGPINAIFFDWEHGSLWGGSSNHGEDYGIGW